MVSDLAKGIEEILPFVIPTIDEEIVNSGDTDLLEETVRELYQLVGDTAGYLLEYVKRGRPCMLIISPFCIHLSDFRVDRVARSLGSEDSAKTKEYADKFAKIKEKFDRALSVEIFKKGREIGECLS